MMSGISDQDGMNLKYLYEFDDRWIVTGSFIFAGATSDNNAVEWSYTAYMADSDVTDEGTCPLCWACR